MDYFVEPASGGSRGAHEMHFGPDGNIYQGSGVNFDSIYRYNGTTGEFMDIFIPPDGRLDGAGSFVFLDGMVYVASFGTDSVLRYDSTTGQFIDEFVAANSGGLDGPATVTFGPDGNLYVLSRNTGEVLRYKAGTGEFMGVFRHRCPGRRKPRVWAGRESLCRFIRRCYFS